MEGGVECEERAVWRGGWSVKRGRGGGRGGE